MIEQASNYDHWAWLYDQTLGPFYSRQKVALFERVLFPHVPAAGRVLDLCCGTGQLVARLAERGYQMTGFDGSADMLRFARQNAPGAVLAQGDARHFTFDQPFDAVTCTSASLNHMESLDDLAGVFVSVNRCLKDGGIFVFDVNHPAQLIRYWLGQPAEGQIRPDHAWLITPLYDAVAGRGAFTVDIYRRPDGVGDNPLKRLIGRIANRTRFKRFRLRLLAGFATFRPTWEHRSITCPVWGHDIEAVGALLRESGFDFEVQTNDGGELDERHAAYFVCRKSAAIAGSGQEAAQ